MIGQVRKLAFFAKPDKYAPHNTPAIRRHAEFVHSYPVSVAPGVTRGPAFLQLGAWTGSGASGSLP